MHAKNIHPQPIAKQITLTYDEFIFNLFVTNIEIFCNVKISNSLDKLYYIVAILSVNFSKISVQGSETK